MKGLLRNSNKIFSWGKEGWGEEREANITNESVS